MSNELTTGKESRLANLLSKESVKKRFDDVLKGRSAAFTSTLLSLYNGKKELQACEPMSIVSAGMMAAVLDLPVNPNLGFAAIVPYGSNAQFQMMWKGYVQLAVRTGQYETIHASEVYEDELAFWNPLTAEFTTTEQSTWKQRDAGQTEKVVGYVSFFKLVNGYRKYLYMTKEQCLRHGKKYSKSFSSSGSRWQVDAPAMCLKTVMKMNLAKYGYLSIELQKAVETDDAIDVDGKIEYPDAIQTEQVKDTQASTVSRLEKAIGVELPKDTVTAPPKQATEEPLMPSEELPI